MAGFGKDIPEKLEFFSQPSSRPASAGASAPSHARQELSQKAGGKEITSKVARIIVGTECVWAVTHGKQVYAWGKNDEGQLGIGDVHKFHDRDHRNTPTLAEPLSNPQFELSGHPNSYHGDLIFIREMPKEETGFEELLGQPDYNLDFLGEPVQKRHSSSLW